jgi:hypothetical protein
MFREKWASRVNRCGRFGHVVSELDRYPDVPPPYKIGACHVQWAPEVSQGSLIALLSTDAILFRVGAPNDNNCWHKTVGPSQMDEISEAVAEFVDRVTEAATPSGGHTCDVG